MSVAIVVVTYNRLSLLKECIAALKKQTYPADAIFVINNGSTDGTTEWLENQEGIQITHQENLGSSGGFSKGIELSHVKGFDWIWVMDDDAEPLPNCLEECLKAADETGADVVAPLLVKASTREVDVMHRGIIYEKGWKLESVPHELIKDKINTNFHQIVDFISFVGPMYSSKVIKSVGLPFQDLFLHHDDFEYSLRIKDAGFKSILTYSAIIMHKEAAHVHVKSTLGFNQPVAKERLFIKYFSPRNKAYIVKKRKGTLAAIMVSVPVIFNEFVRHFLTKPLMLPARLNYFLNAVNDGIHLKLDNSKPRQLIQKMKK